MSTFRWPVSRSGYQWRDESDDHPVYPIDGDGYPSREVRLITFDTGEGVRWYEPLKDVPDLYLEFIEQGGLDKGSLEFAAQYGHLTAGVSLRGLNDLGDDWDELRSGAVKWAGETEEVESTPAGQRASDLWRDLAFPDGCGKDGGWDTAITTAAVPEFASLWGTHSMEMEALFKAWRNPPRTGRAESLSGIWDRIEHALKGRVGFGFEPGSGKPAFVPTDLLSALWLQFAYAVADATSYNTCPVCKQLFAVSITDPTTGRRVRLDKVYCGDDCRMAAAYTKKKAQRDKSAVGQVKASTRRPDGTRKATDRTTGAGGAMG
jgi:hypothetical protein